MIVDLVLAAAVQLGGVAVVLAAGVRRKRLIAPLGFVAGVSLLIVLTFLQAGALREVLVIPTLVALALLPVAAAAIAWGRAPQLRPTRGSLLTGALSIPGAVAAAALLAIDGRVNFHSDTFEYLTVSQLLTSDRLQAGVSIFQLEKRMLGVPALHTASALGDGYVVPTITPLLALACLLLVAGAVSLGLADRLSRRWAVGIAIAAVLALATMNRFVFNAFYINGHLLFATLLLVIAGASWLGARHRGEGLERHLFPIQLLAIPAIIVTRPESGLAVLLALAPTLLDAARPLVQRTLLLATTGASLALWQGLLIALTLSRGGSPTKSILGMFALGLLALVLCWVVRFRWLTGRRTMWLWIGELGLWAALAALSLRAPEILTLSLEATWENIVVGTGGWGLTFDALAIVALIVIALLRDEDRIHLRFTITTFVPLVFILAFLRDSPYRIHQADSLNRMTFQIVPLTVVLIAASAGAVWVWARSRHQDRGGRTDASADQVSANAAGPGTDSVPPLAPGGASAAPR